MNTDGWPLHPKEETELNGRLISFRYLMKEVVM
jgi:hypothetical protein